MMQKVVMLPTNYSTNETGFSQIRPLNKALLKSLHLVRTI
jgi:hypothetical protein